MPFMSDKLPLLIIIVLVACLAGISSDIYSPSLPAIAVSFGTPIDLVQWSMAVYMFGLSVSQLFYGPLSDGLGRKPVLLIGLIIFSAGTFICYFATTIDMLIFGRLVQGLGVGACAALWRSTFRDVFSGPELAKYGSYLSVFMVFVVPAAPALGGYLQETFSWQASFLFLAFYSLVTISLLLTLFQETSIYHEKSRLNPSFIIATYIELLKNRLFMGYSFCVFLTFGAFFSWFAVGPVLLIDILHYSPVEFGWMSFTALCGAMAIGSFLNAGLVVRFGLYPMLRFGWLMTFSGGAIMLLSYWIVGLHAIPVVFSVMIFYLGSTFIFANTFAGAFAKVGKIAGFAGALYGALQIAGGSVLAAVVAYLPDTSPVPLAFVYMGCSALAWTTYKLMVRPLE